MRNLIISCAVLGLIACSSGLMVIGNPVPGPESGYYEHLAHEYGNVADYEADEAASPQTAAAFTEKANKARSRVKMTPDHPDSYDIPDFAREELEQAQRRLLKALKDMYSPVNEPLLALAQAQYECWLVHRSRFREKEAYLSCRDKYYEAMGELSPPDLKNGSYRIYFESGAVVPDSAAMEEVQAAARFYNSHDDWEIVLSSYTDSTGSAAANKTLSMRRAIAVRNALAQQGVNLDHIHIRAEGESLAAKRTAADMDAAQLRRVDIEFRRNYGENGRPATGWEHTDAN